MLDIDTYQTVPDNPVISEQVQASIDAVSAAIEPGSRVLMMGLAVMPDQSPSNFQFDLIRAQHYSLVRHGLVPEHWVIADDSVRKWKEDVEFMSLELPGVELKVYEESSFVRNAQDHIADWERTGKVNRYGTIVSVKNKGPVLMRDGRLSHELLAACMQQAMGPGIRVGIYHAHSEERRMRERVLTRMVRGNDLPGEYFSHFFLGAGLASTTHTSIYNKSMK